MKTGGWGKWCATLSSGHDMAVAAMNSLRQWLPTQDWAYQYYMMDMEQTQKPPLLPKKLQALKGC